MWPHLLFGVYLFAVLWALSPAMLLWSLPLTAGYILAIPFAMMTASPALGAWLARRGLCGIPEDFAMPPVLAAIREGERA